MNTPSTLTFIAGTFGVIDQLTYTYSANIPDRLTAPTDAGSATKGFKYKNSIIGDHYLYDANGNMTQDKHKDLTIAYNHLNLPNSINNLADEYILLTYTADGEKLTKTAGGVTKNYVSGIEYTGANLEAIYHAEGRCVLISDTFRYEYTLKDHLGNARVNFRANGTTVTFLEELHYYPFGMLMEGIGTAAVTVNAYKYNSKELNTDLGLNWSDYGARWYDAAVGRWWSVDPMAEATAGYSVYTYALNNPALLIDPNGMLAGNPFEVMEERKQKAKARREESDKQYKQSVIEKGYKSGEVIDIPVYEKGTDEVGFWRSLTKDDLGEYAMSIGHPRSMLSNNTQMGDFFENIFYHWMMGVHGNDARKGHFTWNRNRMDDSRRRNTVPDFTARGMFEGRWYSGWSIYEAKAVQAGTTIYLTSFGGQTQGHIDNLAARFAPQIARIRGRALGATEAPSITYITTAGVQLDWTVRAAAAAAGIGLFHVVAQYKIVNDQWHFHFGL